MTFAAIARHPAGYGAASLQILALAEQVKGRTAITVGEVLDGFGRANLGLTILLFALPAMIPLPGPIAVFLGSCLAIVAVQVMCGMRRVWLPLWLRGRQIRPSIVAAMADKTVPTLRRAEALLKPRRLKHLTGLGAQAALGFPMLLLSVALALPLPLGNVLPVIALSLTALAILQRDGLAVVVAMVVTIMALVWTVILLMTGSCILDAILSSIGWA
jgi:hypothetical protein